MIGRRLVKVAVSATLVAWLLWRTPLSEIAATLTAVNPLPLAFGLLLSLAAWWISAVRLWVLSPRFGLKDVVRTTFIALYYGTVLPGQVAGDVMKAYRLSQTQDRPGEAVAAAVVDRAIATAVLFLLAAAVAPFVRQAPPYVALVLLATSLGIAAGVYALSHRSVHALAARWVPLDESSALRRIPLAFADGARSVLAKPWRLCSCFALAVLFHLTCLAIHVVLARALGMNLSLASWFLVYAAVALVTLLPVSVAGLGVREGGYVGLLAIFGVAASQALALSFVFFGYIVVGALIGWIVELTHASTANPLSDGAEKRRE